MSDQTESMQQPDTPSSRIILVLSFIAMISGFLVVLTAQLTAPRIEENQRLAIERAVKKVVPGAVTHRAFMIDNGALKAPEKGSSNPVIYAGYDIHGKLLGIAARGGAQGYAGMVYLLYGYDHKCQCVRGFEVLKMAETPGLGDKIITDENFQANFDALDATINADGTALVNPIITVKHGSKKNDWEIDAITGATITSKAVGKALNSSAQKLLPLVLPLIEQLNEMPNHD
ncbi:MAG: RnfABCDGE type electron transport complex subunit G [Gammaproteobacteria bacterium]|nr:RnfABCDGE type electron transport complex subunit G [Gammaproteobacteria bacterium]